MNDCFPDWSFDGDALVSNHRKSFGPDNELIELLWKNGQVVLHSQTHRRPVASHDQSQVRCDGVSSYGNTTSTLIQDDETVSWIQYPLEDDTFQKDFCSGFLSELPSSSHLTEMAKPIRQLEEHRVSKFATFDSTTSPEHMLLSDFTPNPMQQPDQSKHSSYNVEGLSHCGSNQIPNEPDISRASKEHAQPSKYDAQNSDSHNYEEKAGRLTSSSGGSGDSFGKTVNLSPKVRGHKRKAKDAEESECQSKVAELESPVRNKPKSSSARRNRAAEVHSLSERKRRDRINEKMRALQELIPHCNKTDKASMLDEAIEYLKSLQLQLQVMWMASGMTPMVFPGVQHYMSAQNQAAMCQTPLLNPVNYQNQMQNTAFRNQYARFMASRPMNMMGFNSQQMQQNQMMGAHNNGTANGDFAYRNSKTG